jgi:hypothetical protein
MNETTQNWHLTKDEDGIAWLGFDKAGASTNVLSGDVMRELNTRIDEIEAMAPKAVIVHSLKSTGFVAGADIKEFTDLAGPDDALTRTETLSGPFLRHVRLTRGAEEVGGQDVSLLLIDYWAEAPGGQSVVRLAFSTPHVEIRDAMLGLTDKVLFATEWLMSAPGAEPDPDTEPSPSPVGA